MFVARSTENLRLCENDRTNATVNESQGTIPRRPWTRQQSRIEAANLDNTLNNEPSNTDEERIRQIVSDSLSEFRNEISSMLSTEIRNMVISNNEKNPSDEHHERDIPAHHNQVPPAHNDRSSSAHNNRAPQLPHDQSPDGPVNNDISSEKIMNIIKNWRLRFTGNSEDISVTEFIYRVNTLTTSNLNSNFTLLCKHAHLLFDGKALQWYWRFHRNCNDLDWFTLTDALKRQYKDYYTDFDIIDDIRKRKQKKSETFDEYFDAIMILCDKLRNPLSEQELCETILRNLSPEIRLELLHLEISDIAQLRKAVRRHEKFVSDMSSSNNFKRFGQKVQVFEVDCEVEKTSETVDSDDNEVEVCVVKIAGKCWNCEKFGHNYMDCLEPRKVFCYGCGLKDTYRPQCNNCSGKRGNFPKDVRPFKNGHPKN